MNEMMEMAELEALTSGLKARKVQLERKLASVETPSVVVQHPAAAEVYGLLAQRLHEMFEGDDGEEIGTHPA